MNKIFSIIIITICFCSYSFSQDAGRNAGQDGFYSHKVKSDDSVNYAYGVKYFNEGKKKFAKNKFLNVFVGEFSAWHDSTIKFLEKNNKLEWLSDISEINLKGYRKQDSLHYEYGRQLFLDEKFYECKQYFLGNSYYDLKYSIYSDSVDNLINHVSNWQDSIDKGEKLSREKMERKWVYLGEFYSRDKYGYYSLYPSETYYDANHLLYEGDSVCVVLKVGDYNPVYKYVSVNLVTKIVHGIDASKSDISYNYIWDGDWWIDPNSDFNIILYNEVKR